MNTFLQWITGNPLRAFLVAGLAAVLPLGAWLPAGFVVFGLLAGGEAFAFAGMGGAVLALVWAYVPLVGAGPALAIAAVAFLPSLLGGFALDRSRSLSFVFQALTVASCLVVLAIHGLLGDPVQALAPVMAGLEPVLRQAADFLARFGIVRTPEEIGEATASFAWASFGWMVLFNAFAAQCAGLWAFGKLREPGLFGREFRALKLGHFMGWLFAAVFLASVVAGRVLGEPGWPAAEDVRFVLAAAFLIQALAVVHGLRELQVIGVLSVVLAYVAVLLVPMALVGIGFADTWVRFRERFAPRQGV
jgi:hypothetical protein